MNPAPAPISNPYGVELTPQELAVLVQKHIRAFKDAGGNLTVVVSTPPASEEIAKVLVCTHPPCW